MPSFAATLSAPAPYTLVHVNAPSAPANEGEAWGPLEVAMARFADGDEAAFREVYRAVAPRLQGLFLRLGMSACVSDDLVQESMLRIHRARASYRRGAKVLPWVYAIARRLVIDRGREKRRERATSELYALALVDVGGPARADQQLAAKRMALAVDSALDQMPEGQAVAFRLVREEGFSLNEAASALASTNLAMRLRTHRACKALREALHDHL